MSEEALFWTIWGLCGVFVFAWANLIYILARWGGLSNREIWQAFKTGITDKEANWS